MRVALYVTCLVDQVWPSVGEAAVRVLRSAGCEVDFDPRATCCGQPAYNTGYHDQARPQARQWIESFEHSGAEWAVLPSGSCAAMVHHYPRLFERGDPWRGRAEAFAERAKELCGFLVDVLGVDDLGARCPARVTWHDACHGLRELGLRDEPRRLLGKVADLELIEMEGADQCCGFGGTFSVKYPELSTAIVDRKCESVAATDADYVVSGDVSCLMQIEGRLRRIGSTTRAVHVAEVLAGMVPARQQETSA